MVNKGAGDHQVHHHFRFFLSSSIMSPLGLSYTSCIRTFLLAPQDYPIMTDSIDEKKRKKQ